LCLVRAILVGLCLSFNQARLQEVFKSKLTDEEIKKLNYRRQANKTKINEGILSEVEIKYLRQGGNKKLQTILAHSFHRIYSIPIKDTGNDFSDIKSIEEILGIEIQVYSIDTRQIYAGIKRPVKIYFKLSNNHYDVISSLPAFLGSNVRRWESIQKQKCEACKNPIQCKKEDKLNV